VGLQFGLVVGIIAGLLSFIPFVGSLVGFAASVGIAFQDTGVGLNEEQRQRLFAPFLTTKAKGTGLGLFIVQTTMENHGGRLEIDRSPLGGAAFHMVFPKGEAQI
jgi:signal transduction histidine kinase